MSIKVLEAFAGIGAQRKALTNIGLDYESVGIIEIDKPAEKFIQPLTWANSKLWRYY